MKLKNHQIICNDDIQKDEAIDILVAHGMKGVERQRNKPTTELNFVDADTAKQAYDILNTKLHESRIARLRELAGMPLNESVENFDLEVDDNTVVINFEGKEVVNMKVDDWKKLVSQFNKIQRNRK